MKYKEIFELKSIGLNNSQIGRRLGISRNTVRKYLGMSHEEFEAWLHSLETREKKLDPHKDRILHWLKEYPDTSSAQILDWLEEKLGVTNVSEGTVRNYVNELREIYHIPKTANYRVYTAVEELPPGVQCQVDFGETVLLTEYGERRKVYCIGFVLAHSRYKYVEWLDRPFRTVDVIRMHENAFRFYDGMPEEIVYDQDKLLTVSENAGDLLLTEQFQSYRDYRGFRVHLCRKADPESKGKIESVIKFVKYNFSKNRTFVDLEKLNQQTVEWLKRTGNRKVHQTIKKRPFKVFALEKQHLKSLSTSYIFSPSSDMKIISRNVQKDNTIRFEGNRYSVPAGTYHPRTANRVFLDINESRLRIRLEPDGNTIADHPLSEGKGNLITDPSHKRKSGTKTAILCQEVQQLFQNHELIKWYLKELRAKYPRHLIDQLVVMRHAIHQHPEFADEALRLAKMYNLISANDYRDILFSLHKESESKENKAAENTQSKYSHLQASERDVSYYVGLLEGDSQ